MVVPPVDHKLAVIQALSSHNWKTASEIAQAVDITDADARDYIALDTFSYEYPVEEYVREICTQLVSDGSISTDDNRRYQLAPTPFPTVDDSPKRAKSS